MHNLKPIPNKEKIKCISQQVVEWHHQKHHKGYVDKRNEIEERLKAADKTKANPNHSDFGELKRRETFNASGMILHEIYWDVLGGSGDFDKNSKIIKKIIQDFSSFESWKEDFIAVSKSSLGWAVLCYDPSDKKLHNYLTDFHNNGVVIGSMPLLALDVFEHAYYHDYGPDRAKYIDEFLKNINWKAVEEKFVKL